MRSRGASPASGGGGGLDTRTTERPAPGTGHRPGRGGHLLLAVVLVLLAVPLVIALGALREPRWHPATDDAQTELRVRDVWSADPPLTGLGGRIGPYGPDQGSHPGPLSFWSLALPHRLFGSSSWALQVATATLHVVAMGMTLWLARRRGGIGLLLGVAVALVVLVDAYGGYALTLPWNPYLPMLWWVTFLMGVWSLLREDLAALPVTVFAASFCLQTHISYLGLVGAVAALGAVAVAITLHRTWRDGPQRRRSLTWVALGAVIAAIVWFPPVAEQLTGSQGRNFSAILRHFGEPSEEPIGLRSGLELLVANLDASRLLTEPVIDGVAFLGGTLRPGTLLLGAWALAVATAWCLRERALLRLHAVLAVALLAAVVSVSRIFGPPWAYLALWAWGLCALLVVAVGWSASALVLRLLPTRLLPAPLAVVGAVAVLVALTARSAIDAADTDVFQPELSASGAALVPDTIAALDDRAAPGGGRVGRYLVTWNDPPFQGGRGFMLLNELDRAGFEVGADPFYRGGVTRHRALTPDEATAELHVAVGEDVATWRAEPRYREIASYAPFGQEGAEELERLRDEVAVALEGLGRPELVRDLREDPQRLAGAVDLPQPVRTDVERMIALRSPAAVFVGPPGAGPS